MSELRSECHGAEIEYKFYEWSNGYSRAEALAMTMGGKTLEKSGLKPFCFECGKLTEVKEKAKDEKK